MKPQFGELFAVKQDCKRHTPGKVVLCVSAPLSVSRVNEEYRFRGVLLDYNTIWNFYFPEEVDPLYQSMTYEDTAAIFAGVI